MTPPPSFVVTASCVGCGLCLRTCPERAIRATRDGLIVLPLCTGCGECAEVCPVDACVEVPAVASAHDPAAVPHGGRPQEVPA